MKDYVDALFAAQNRAVLAALTSQNERLNGMNEFRQTLTDQSATFATRESVDILRQDMDRRAGAKAGLAVAWGYIIGAVGIAAAVVAVIVGTRGT